MKKLLCKILILLLLSSQAQAEVVISPKNHMQNQDPGRCAWCALETLTRTHGYKNSEGMVESNPRGAYQRDMIAELDKYQINYEVQWPEWGEYFYYLMYQKLDEPNVSYVWAIKRNKKEAEQLLKNSKEVGRWWIERKLHWDTSFLRDAIKADLGAAVSLNYIGADPKYQHERHMVVIINMDDESVLLVDSNDKPGIIKEMPLYQFLQAWNGFAIKILKNGR